MQKPQFAKVISWRSFVERKPKETFVLLILRSVTFAASLIVHMITLIFHYCLVSAYLSLFCLDNGSIPGRSTFFFSLIFSAKNTFF